MKASRDLCQQDALEKLQAEIDRLSASSRMMRAANAALVKRDEGALRAMGFSDAHIAELLKRVECGRSGFPDYALRNNNNDIRCLRRCMAELASQIPVRHHH